MKINGPFFIEYSDFGETGRTNSHCNLLWNIWVLTTT